MAKMAGCAISVSCRRDVSAGSARWSSRDQPASAAKRASRSASASRNTGSDAASSRPICAHCGPCPEKTKATRGRATVGAAAQGHGGRRVSGEEALQLLGRVRRGPGDDGQAMVVVRAARAGGGGQRRQRVGRARQEVEPRRGERAQGGGRLGREGEQLRLVGVAGSRDREGWRLLDQDVSVGPADAEPADARHPRPTALGPGPMLVGHRQAGAVQREVRVERGEVQLPGDLAVLQDQGRLDEPGHAGRGLEVPDVGLGGPEVAGAAVGPRRADGGGQRLDLDGVAERRARAVRLDEADAVRRQLGVGERVADQRLLREPVRGRQHGRVAVLVDGRAADHRQDPVVVGDGVGQALEHDDAAALAAHEAVGPRVEGPAASGGRHEADLGERDHEVRRQHQGHAAGQRHVALASPQALAGQVHGDQRRRAGRVDRHARAPQVEQVRQAVGQHAVLRAGQRAGVDPLGIGEYCITV